MSFTGRQKALLTILAAISAALTWRIASDLSAPVTLDAPPAASAAAADGDVGPPQAPPYEAPPAERFIAVLDRPLFSPDRRPETVESAAPTAAPRRDESLKAQLRGVVLADPEAAALITPEGSTQVLRVALGELFRGWRLREVHPDHVVFEHEGREERLDLIYRSDPVAPARPRR